VHIEIPGKVKESTANVVDAGRDAAVVVSEGLSNQVLLTPRVEVAKAGAEIATADRAVEGATTSTPNTDDITSFCEVMSNMDATGGKSDTPLAPGEYATPASKSATAIGGT